MPRLKAFFSGQFKILLNNQPVNLGYNKVRALLAYLIMENNQAHSRDELAGLFWPDILEVNGRKNLRQALMNLRIALKEEDTTLPFLSVNRETIQFNLGTDFSSDTLTISSLLKTSKEHNHKAIELCQICYDRLFQAAELYKGDFLSGLSIPDSLPFEEWLLFSRERSRLQAIELLGILVSACEAKHEYEAAIQFSRRRLMLDPWNEDAYRALMRTLWRLGQRTTALAEYERCKRILSDDLSISPSKNTIDLAEQIRYDAALQDLSETPASLGDNSFLPVPLSALIGRESEIQALVTLLKQNEIRLVTLMGPPGIGKTRLALQLADILKEEFDRNVHFISLVSITNPDFVLETIAHTLGLGVGIHISPLNFLERIINRQRMLLVLDNFEQVLAAGPSILKLMQACPNLKVLATSQTPLKVRGEQRFYLKPLALPDPVRNQNVSDILSSPAVKLFVDTLQHNVPGIPLDAQNIRIAAEICIRLDGLPLAIELAAASAKTISLRELLKKINEPAISAIKIFENQNSDTDARHHTLWRAFQWNFDLLDRGAQILFFRLGIFSGSWSLEAAEAICNIGDIPNGSTESMTKLLENCVIQQVETQAGEYRFSMLATIREFALDHMRKMGENDIMHQRHTDYYLSFARLAEPELSRHNQMEWLERIECDLDNFRTSLEWCLENSPGEALQLCVSLFPYWHIRSHLEEGRNYLERACAINPHPTQTRAQGLAKAGLLAQRQGNYFLAENLIDQSIEIFRLLNDQRGLAYALNNLAIVKMSTGEQEQAYQKASESLSLCRELNDQLGVARVEMTLGQLALNQDDLSSAWHALETSRKFWRMNGDYKNLILSQINLGRIRISQRKYNEAEILLEESLGLSRKIKDHHWELVAMWNLADINLKCGNHTDALPIYSEIHQRVIKLGDRYLEALTIDRLGIISVMNHDFEQGVVYFSQSQEIGQTIGSVWIIANALSDLGFTHYLQDDSRSAYRLLTQSAHLFLNQNEQAGLVLNLERLALASIQLEKLKQAGILFGAAETWRCNKGEPIPPISIGRISLGQDELKARLGEDAFTSYWSEGQALSLHQIVTELDQP